MTLPLPPDRQRSNQRRDRFATSRFDLWAERNRLSALSSFRPVIIAREQVGHGLSRLDVVTRSGGSWAEATALDPSLGMVVAVPDADHLLIWIGGQFPLSLDDFDPETSYYVDPGGGQPTDSPGDIQLFWVQSNGHAIWNPNAIASGGGSSWVHLDDASWNFVNSGDTNSVTLGVDNAPVGTRFRHRISWSMDYIDVGTFDIFTWTGVMEIEWAVVSSIAARFSPIGVGTTSLEWPTNAGAKVPKGKVNNSAVAVHPNENYALAIEQQDNNGLGDQSLSARYSRLASPDTLTIKWDWTFASVQSVLMQSTAWRLDP